MSAGARTCVVICYWTGRSPTPLWQLLRSMSKFEAGAAYDVLVVCNGGDTDPLRLPPALAASGMRVLNRENTGWNLGAWEAGWRASPGYTYYLFLQAECYVKRAGWIHRFEHRSETDAGIGMLGERLMWQQMSWDYVREATALDLGERGPVPEGVLESVAAYQGLLRGKGIEPGPLGTHLVSIILFIRRDHLERIGGFPLVGDSYLEAVACEIGLSKLIETSGLRISQVSDAAFAFIGHSQWRDGESAWQSLRTRLKRAARKLALRE